jgi:ABC-2 type transport system permease protein
MNALNIAWKDLQIFVRERGQLFYLFLLPFVFIVVFTGVYSAIGDTVEKIALAVVNLDPGGEMAQSLMDNAERVGALEIVLYSEDEAQSSTENGDIERYLLIPAGFTQDIAADVQVTLHLINGPDADESQTEAMYTLIDGVAKDLALQSQLIAGFRQMGDMMAGATEESEAFTTDVIVAQAQSQFERARTAPLVGVEQKIPEAILRTREELPNAIDLSVPGFAVFFAFLTAQATATFIFLERKIGTFRRLLAAPMGRAELVGGKMIYGVITTIVQLIVIFGVSIFVLPLLGSEQMSLGSDPLAFVLLSLMTAICSASLGLLIAAISRTEGQITGIGSVALYVMGLIGGVFIPQQFLGDFLGTLGKFVPHYWAIAGYQDLIVRGLGLADITVELAALAGFSLVFFVVGLWRFRFE